MFEIGASLAAARKGQSLTLSDAERLTCLRERYLQALEEERFDALPGRAYARAFLRTYAAALGLDADPFVREYDRRHPEPEPEEPLPVIRPRRSGRLGPQILAGVAVAVVAAVAIVWTTASSNRSEPPAATRVAAALPAPTASPPKRHAVRSAATTHRAGAAPLVISATGGRCWLLVRRGGVGGHVLYEGTLEQGRSIRFAAPRVWVRFGAPWNVAVRRGSHRVAGLSSRSPVNLVA